MRVLALCSFIFSTGLILTGCSAPTLPPSDHAQPVPNTKKANHSSAHQKNPVSVTLINGQEKIIRHYTVIGEATVSKYNVAGIKRQKAIIQDRLNEIAASMGGDAIMNLKNKSRYVTGTVITIIPDSLNHV